MNGRQSRIHGEVLLLCERLEQAQFLHAYLRHLCRQGVDLTSAQVVNYNGLQNLQNLAVSLPKMSGSSRVRKAAFFADAACDLHGRKEVLTTVRSSTYFYQMEYCPYFFFPGMGAGRRWRQGYLEDALLPCLRLETAESGDYYSLYNIAEEYLVCVNNQRGRQNKLINHSRHLLYAYLAATEKYAGLRLGEAAQQGAFDLNSEALASLREHMEKLRLQNV